MNLANLYNGLALGEMPSAVSILNTPEGLTFGAGKTVGNGVEGWAPSAIFVHTDGATASTRVYMNTGTKTTASWSSVYTAGAALSLDEAFDNGATINGAVSEATAVKIGGATDYFTLWQEGANDIRIGTSAGANITMVPAGGTFALTGAMTVSGALTVSGLITGTFGGTISTSTWTASPVITSSEVTGAGMTVNGNEITTGDVLLINADASLTTGKFLNCKNAGTTKFSVGLDGRHVIAGTASGTAALTLTAGDLVVTSGNVTFTAGTLTLSEGSITATITSAADLVNLNPNAGGAAIDIDLPATSNLATGYIDIDGSTGSGPMIACAASSTYTGNFIDLNMTNAVGAKGILLTGAGTRTTALISMTDAAPGNGGYGILMTSTAAHANYRSIKITESGTVASKIIDIAYGGASTGVAINVNMTNAAVTSQALVITSNVAATVSPIAIVDTGFVGASGVGLVNISATGALAHAQASCLRIAYSGAGAATGLGTSIRVVDTGSTATSYAVYISSATGEALFVDTGKAKFTEGATFKASNRNYIAPNYVAAGGSNNAITITLTDADGNNVTLAAGLMLVVHTGAYTLQAGANTLNLNGGGAVAIKKGSAATVDKAVAAAANSILCLVYNGTSWLDTAE